MSFAIGMIEFNSIAKGIFAADQMVKTSQVDIVSAKSVCPGKYIAIVHGDVSSVENAVAAGSQVAGSFFVDKTIIPNVHKDVFPAIVSANMPEEISSLGIIESYSLSSMIVAADAVLKCANLEPIEIRLGTGLGGKAYFTFTGDVADVKTGVEVGKEVLGEEGMLINAEIIPSPAKKLINTLY